MAVDDQYIVNFEEAVRIFEKRLAREDLPTIDLDQVKWQIMTMFEHIDPSTQLYRLVDDMLKHDWLYDKVEFVDTTPMEARRKKIEMNQYLRDALIELGNNMYFKLRELGMMTRDTERYKVISRPLDNETYTLRQTRV